VAQGTYYIYFHSKREIFIELIEDLGKRLRAGMRAAIAGSSDRLQVERRGFAAFFKFAAEHRHIYSIIQEAERVAPEACYAYYQSISQSYIQGLQAAIEEGNIRDLNPEAVAYALMGIGHFVALRWLIWPQATAEDTSSSHALPEDIFQAVMDFITYGLSRGTEKEKNNE
jgi:AcrR family transcriptional regulator